MSKSVFSRSRKDRDYHEGTVELSLTNADDEEEARSAEAEFSDSMSKQIGLRLRFAQAAVWGDLLRTFKPFGFRPQQYAALKIIASNSGCKQQDLGTALGISRSNLVMLIDELVGQGLIVRNQNLDDRRSNALELSRRGNILMPELDRAQAEHEARIAAVLNANERATLANLLNKLQKI